MDGDTPVAYDRAVAILITGSCRGERTAVNPSGEIARELGGISCRCDSTARRGSCAGSSESTGPTPC